MPKAQEEALMRAANKLAASGKLKNAGKYKSLKDAKKSFVFGTMRKHSKGQTTPWWGNTTAK